MNFEQGQKGATWGFRGMPRGPASRGIPPARTAQSPELRPFRAEPAPDPTQKSQQSGAAQGGQRLPVPDTKRMKSSEGGRYHHPGNQWISESWAVKAGVVRDILEKLQSGKPSIDAFAMEGNQRFERFWGVGGEETNAWDRDWGMEPLVWMNPPFSTIGAVVDKIRWDQARCRAETPCARRD